jgi:hypothetical protein
MFSTCCSVDWEQTLDPLVSLTLVVTTDPGRRPSALSEPQQDWIGSPSHPAPSQLIAIVP